MGVEAVGIPPPITASWVFYLIAAFVVVSAISVVVIRNVIHAALALGACFTGIAGIYVLLHAQFLAVAQVLVYVGDVTVLILFALMLTRGLNHASMESWGVPTAAGVAIAIAICALLVSYVSGAASYFLPGASVAPLQTLGSYGIVLEFSKQMLTVYVLPFEVASGILLMALVGAIVIARDEPGPASGGGDNSDAP